MKGIQTPNSFFLNKKEKRRTFSEPQTFISHNNLKTKDYE